MSLRVLVLGEIAADVRQDLRLLDDGVELIDAAPGAALHPAQIGLYRPHLLVLGDAAPFAARDLFHDHAVPSDDPVPVLSTAGDLGADLQWPAPGAARDAVLRLARRLGRLRRAALDPADTVPLGRGAVLLSSAARFGERLDYEFARSMRYRHPVSLVTATLEPLDGLVAAHGDAALEEFLALVTETFRRCLRDVDLLHRSPERELLAILPETQASGARLAGDRFLAATLRLVFKPSIPTGRPALPFRATSSIGVADGPREGIGSARELLARARDSMSIARSAGGGRVHGGPEIARS
jgi:GGDEF domain-containing protein